MKIYLTDVGQALLYKAQGGKVLKFTRFGLGDGELNGQAIQKLTTLLNEKMSSVISKKSSVDLGALYIISFTLALTILFFKKKVF